MSNTLRIRLTPADKNHSSIIGVIEVNRAEELQETIKAGGYLKVTRDNQKVLWVNLAHILKVEETPKGESESYVYSA